MIEGLISSNFEFVILKPHVPKTQQDLTKSDLVYQKSLQLDVLSLKKDDPGDKLAEGESVAYECYKQRSISNVILSMKNQDLGKLFPNDF